MGPPPLVDPASEKFLRQAMELAPGVPYVFDLSDSRSLYASGRAGHALGYSADEIVEMGSSFLGRLLHDHDRSIVFSHHATLASLRDGETACVEYRLRHRNGSWRWFESTDAPYARDAEGRVCQCIGVATEITDRKHAEEALAIVADNNRYRAKLADTLRGAGGPVEAQRVAATILGGHLGATRAHYADVVDDGQYGVVHSDYSNDVESVRGRYRLDDYGAAVMADLRGGRIVRVSDVESDPRFSESEKAETTSLDTRAFVMAPLMNDGRLVATLVLHQNEPRVWSDEEVALVEETLERTGATAESVRRHAAETIRHARYKKLFESIDEGFCLCEMIADEAGRAVDYRFLEVNRRFEEQTGLVDAVGKTAYELVPNLERHWVDTYARVGLGGETIRFEEGSESMGRWFDVYAAPVDPVGCGQLVIVFKDASDRKRAERALVESEETQRRARYRALLVADIVGALDPLDTVAGMAQRLVDELVPRFADYASLEIPDSAEPVMALAHRDPEMLHVLRLLREGHRLERDDAHSISRAAAGEAQLISRITPDTLHEYAREDESVELLTRLGPRSHIAVPVDVLGDRGALLVGLSDETRRPYTDHELELAQEIALRAGALLGRALAREDERSVAVRLQEVLLPEALPVHPSLQVAARYQSGSAQLQVGGDWYDAFMLSGGRIAFSVGDVVGHGLEAAAAMGRLRVALAALALNSEAPAEVVTRLDEFSCGVGGVDFATVCYALLDSATGVVRYAAAGHPPLLVVSADGQTQWLSGGRSAPLGIERDESIRPEAACTLQPGDLVIAYSDGLIERRGESIDGGLERLEAQARTLFASPVDDVCRRLIETLVTGASNDDDVVVLCLRFSPVTAANFHRVMPARPEELAPTRAALGAWITEHHPSANLEDLLIATGEALANAVEHAYDDPSQGVVRLTVAANFDGGLDVEVRDHGRWRAGQTDDRGHGTRIMSQLADEFSRHTGDEGTTVSFTMPARGPVSLAGRWLK